MNNPTLTLYATACLAGALIPGPTSLLAMTNGARRNWAFVAAGMVGAALSDMLVIGLVGLGLGTLLSASEAAFAALRWIGAGYLVFLAVQMWRADPSLPASTPVVAAEGLGVAFRRSFLVAISNPKVLLFFTAFLPQFIDATLPAAGQYAVLAVISAGIDVLVMALYAVFGAQVTRWLGSTGMRHLLRGSAILILSAAAFVALSRRSAS